MICIAVLWFFFFKQKTAYELRISDWSSDVCSSDLEGTLKLLRLYDGQAVLCYPIAEVIDIVRLPDAVQPSAAPGLIAGVVLVGGEPVELIDPFWLMEQYAAGAAAAPASRQPLCRLADDRDGWGGNFPAPIPRSAGEDRKSVV